VSRETQTVALLREARDLERQAHGRIVAPPYQRPSRGGRTSVTRRAEHIRRYATGQDAADLDRAAALRWEAARLQDRIALGFARHWRSFLPLEDVRQEARLGLYEACCRFDPDRGVLFATHARWWVRARLSRWCGAGDHMANNAREHVRNALKLEALGITRDEEVAERLGLPLATLRHIRAVDGPVLSLDAPVGDDLTLLGTLQAEVVDPVEIVHARDEDRLLRRALRLLSERERHVLRMHQAGCTLAQIGEAIGLSRERVRQIQAGAVRTIREAVSA
jgi:RNA polymerase sigma factor (sigma-70 family)